MMLRDASHESISTSTASPPNVGAKHELVRHKTPCAVCTTTLVPQVPNFELADIGVGSIAECRYKPRQCPLNRSECRFNSLSGHRLIARAMAELRLPVRGAAYPMIQYYCTWGCDVDKALPHYSV